MRDKLDSLLVLYHICCINSGLHVCIWQTFVCSDLNAVVNKTNQSILNFYVDFFLINHRIRFLSDVNIDNTADVSFVLFSFSEKSERYISLPKSCIVLNDEKFAEEHNAIHFSNLKLK